MVRYREDPGILFEPVVVPIDMQYVLPGTKLEQFGPMLGFPSMSSRYRFQYSFGRSHCPLFDDGARRHVYPVDSETLGNVPNPTFSRIDAKVPPVITRIEKYRKRMVFTTTLRYIAQRRKLFHRSRRNVGRGCGEWKLTLEELRTSCLP